LGSARYFLSRRLSENWKGSRSWLGRGRCKAARRLMPHSFWYLRPEGPPVARPGRQAGIELERNRAPKVRHYGRCKCRTFGALAFFIPFPGLTAGSISMPALRASCIRIDAKTMRH
jgi:hypothetical protein